MLLIILLGFIAKLAMVSTDSDIGPLPMKDFNFTKFSDSRTWCGFYHTQIDFLKKYDCIKITLSSPEGNVSYITTDIYDKSKQDHIIQYGNITNWNSSGCYEVYHPVELWSGPLCVISTDYDSYCIAKLFSSVSDKMYVFVGLRSCPPDEPTRNAVLKALKANNIDVGKLLRLPANQC